MWEGLFTLVTFSIAMAGASFVSGSLPLSFGLTPHSSRVIAAIGTGLLIGTCLIIIIPEGVGTLYSAQPNPLTQIPYDIAPENMEDYFRIRKRQEHEHEHHDPHAWVGLSLVVGFVMMYLIDQLPRHKAKLSARQGPTHVSLADMSAGLHRGNSSSPTAEEAGQSSHDQAIARSSATTIGLVIHAIADGVALAASTFIAEKSLGFVVFLALMVHKAPAAFGLTSVLLKQGLTKREARMHLVVFSLAAPVGAFLTWILVNLLAEEVSNGEETIRFATGLLLLFSGGTFLYVAMHTMQESSDDTHDDTSNGYGDGHAFGNGQQSKGEGKSMGFRDTLLAVVGMLLPLLAQLGHAH